VKQKYGILNADTYNFNKSGFQMGVISSRLVITGSERRSSSRSKAVQPGNREWATVIAAINALGWVIPPFIIVSAMYHLSAWYEGSDLPPDWSLSVSDNGWTTNDLGIAWLKHFDLHTKLRTQGTRRLLILDSHESHRSARFNNLATEKGIILLYMPAHASHLLQPLDVGCFGPLKTAYGHEIESLARNHINHITKLEFLLAFRAAFYKAFTEKNICLSF
jgi:hypothetical protein